MSFQSSSSVLGPTIDNLVTLPTGTRKLFTILGSVCALALAVAAPAPAATTFGANLAAVPDSGGLHGCPLMPYPSSCDYVLKSSAGGYAAPFSGVITRWRTKAAFQPAGTALLAPKVVRELGGDLLLGVATGAPANVNTNGITETPTRLRVTQGDLLGVEVGTPSGAPDPYAPFVFVNISVPDVWLVQPSLIDGLSDHSGTEALRPLINADIEIDADNDGYGDETQDGCPSQAATQGACVAPPVKTCKVPKLKGLTRSKAKAALITANCKLGKTTKKKSKKGKKGRATKQSPAAGKVVAAGTSVSVTLRK